MSESPGFFASERDLKNFLADAARNSGANRGIVADGERLVERMGEEAKAAAARAGAEARAEERIARLDEQLQRDLAAVPDETTASQWRGAGQQAAATLLEEYEAMAAEVMRQEGLS